MKTYFVSMGCPKNSVDMEAALTLLLRAGHEITDDPEAADLLLVNSCSFLESAWRETVEELERLARFKRRYGGKRLVLMGCLPKHRKIDLAKTMPDVDAFLSPGEHGLLPGLLSELRPDGDAPAASRDPFAGFEGRSLLTPAHTAYVKIGEGCSHSCDFCAIPIIKGPMLSRSPSSILREVEGMVETGVREITVIAQDPASYRWEDHRLPGLLETLARTGIDWIRVLYLHPASIRIDELLRIFEIPQVCRYLDVPVQHASNRLLSRMKRGYKLEYVERFLGEMKRVFPDIVLRSEVITGYPGESEDDFEELKSFITRAGFSTLGVFSFSPEPGTAAFDSSDTVPPAVQAERYSELVSVHEAFAFGIHSERIGSDLKILADRPLSEAEDESGGCRFAGRYYGQAYEVDGEVFLRGDAVETGQFVMARIVDATVFDLIGEVIEKA
jgi:ribosomal protein S12 methylthiotransferase